MNTNDENVKIGLIEAVKLSIKKGLRKEWREFFAKIAIVLIVSLFLLGTVKVISLVIVRRDAFEDQLVGKSYSVNVEDLKLHSVKFIGYSGKKQLAKGTEVTLTGHVKFETIHNFLSSRYDAEMAEIMVEITDGIDHGWVAYGYLEKAPDLEKPNLNRLYSIILRVLAISIGISFWVSTICIFYWNGIDIISYENKKK